MSRSSKTCLGIGNPLLDISVQADQALFDKYGIKAGNATLAEEKDLPLYDEIQQFPSVSYLAGGATQNTMRGLAWMNPCKGRTHYIGCVGNDENASILRSSAIKAGLTTHYDVSTKPTGRCAVLVNSNKERSLIADLSAANDYKHDHFLSSEIQELLESVDIFYSASFFLTVSPQTSVAVGKYCVEKNKTFVINLSAIFLIDFFWDQLNQVLPYADYVIGNESEAEAFAKKSGWDAEDLQAAALKLSQLPKIGRPDRTVVFTQGPRPTIVARTNTVTLYDVPPVPRDRIVDTNGAGDAFAGGFLAGLALDKSIEDCVKAGNSAGSVVIQREGPTYPDTCEYVWE
eukprot:TRINITY_DN3274_c0_g1_i3.p1 TRINITY_DN3274_c0_g1~~TRINITY_DN3274_c0_g1_i3.p1  ORF type:complete len:364 (+),score=63.29 TRINITY_DN3274_c0_g1_i3:61-1092(+)